MDDAILIVSPAETFTVRGLEMKLNEMGVNTQYSDIDIKRLKAIREDISLVILYTDNISDEHMEALVYMKDFCLENNSMIIVVGTQVEYEYIKKHIPQGEILNFYERPLVMNKLLEEIEEFFNRKEEYSKRKSILIVDDDVAYMTMIFDWLKDTYKVNIANSGMQAITWLAKNNVDLILLDYEMPITSGPQVLEMIRSEPASAGIPVIFLTGKADKESVERVMRLKPQGYLLKSTKKEDIIASVDNFFATG